MKYPRNLSPEHNLNGFRFRSIPRYDNLILVKGRSNFDDLRVERGGNSRFNTSGARFERLKR